MDDAETLDRLNHYWDAVARGRSAAPDGLGPARAAAVHRLHLAGHAAAPDPTFAARLWEDLMSETVPTNSLTLTRPLSASNGWAPTPWPRLPARQTGHVRPRRRLADLTLVAVLVLTLGGGYLAYDLATPARTVRAPAAQPATSPEPAPAALFIYDYPGRELAQLDPMTLADSADAVVSGAALSGTLWIASADGSTLVSVENGSIDPGRENEAVVVVRDGRTGVERTRFHPPSVPVIYGLLNGDGTRLLLETSDYPLAWHVVDTANGQTLAVVRTAEPPPWRSHLLYWIDPAGSNLYTLACTCSRDEATGPSSAQLVRYDLSTGAESGRIDLPDVLAGFWQTTDASDGDPAYAHLTPGGALSPDGRQLAIAHADGEGVTLVDLQRFAVERTVAPTRPTSALDRLLGLLPLVPEGAEAKQVPAGTARYAVFSPDGRYLYVFGFENWMIPNGGEERRGLGLQVVDLERGEIVAEISPDALITQVLPAPDGQSVYVTLFEPERPPLRLQRLDAVTLATLAEREFPDGVDGMFFLPLAGP